MAGVGIDPVRGERRGLRGRRRGVRAKCARGDEQRKNKNGEGVSTKEHSGHDATRAAVVRKRLADSPAAEALGGFGLRFREMAGVDGGLNHRDRVFPEGRAAGGNMGVASQDARLSHTVFAPRGAFRAAPRPHDLLPLAAPTPIPGLK